MVVHPRDANCSPFSGQPVWWSERPVHRRPAMTIRDVDQPLTNSLASRDGRRLGLHSTLCRTLPLCALDARLPRGAATCQVSRQTQHCSTAHLTAFGSMCVDTPCRTNSGGRAAVLSCTTAYVHADKLLCCRRHQSTCTRSLAHRTTERGTAAAFACAGVVSAPLRRR